MKPDWTNEIDDEELERMRRRRARIQRMKREKERQLRLQRLVRKLIPVAVVLLMLLIGIIVVCVKGCGAGREKGKSDVIPSQTGEENRTPDMEAMPWSISAGDVSVSDSNQAAGNPETNLLNPVVSTKQFSATQAEDMISLPEEVNSSHVILVDMNADKILVKKDCFSPVNPASMTKVLTLLVAAEHITNLDDTFTMTIDITDYAYSNDCSSVGFQVGEQVTVRDLLYGTILPSGGDAAVGLATYVAGSQEDFVKLMNEKLEILGLSDTAHFTNCVGLYDQNHYCTVYDMAMIMEAALDNELCKEVLSAHSYTTSATKEHPEGITVSNWFLRRIEDKETGGTVQCAKTGFVAQSGNCAVSFGFHQNGEKYVCVTTGAHSSWRCIYDHVAIYKAIFEKNS